MMRRAPPPATPAITIPPHGHRATRLCRARRAPAAAPVARGFFRDLALVHIANALVGFLFAASGPLAIILATGSKGGLSEADLASWVFGSLAINGVVSIAYSLAYRQPLAFFWTIPGTILVGLRARPSDASRR